MHIWLNGELLDALDARLPAQSAGTLLGWGVFTTLGVWLSHPFALPQHLKRLRHDASELGLELPFTDYELDSALYDTIDANGVTDGLGRFTVTARGDGRWNLAGGSDVSILTHQHPSSSALSRPLRLGISPYCVALTSALQGIKSTAYASHLRAWHTAQNEGLDDAVLLTPEGSICEASRANIFWVKEGVLFTPGAECGPLLGIARELVLVWCRQHGIITREGDYSLADLQGAEEIFLTASTTGPRPVERLTTKGQELYLAAPGPVTQQLIQRWAAAVRNGPA